MHRVKTVTIMIQDDWTIRLDSINLKQCRKKIQRISILKQLIIC